jgi:hypothetical protein
MNPNPEISITQALNQIQSWLNAGEFDKVSQGCQEILNIEPGNQRALSMMRQAEEARFAESQHEPMPAPEPAPTFEPPSLEDELNQPGAPVEEPTGRVEQTQDPLAKLEVEDGPHIQPEHEVKPYELQDKKRMFLAMLIPAMLVIIIGGSLIWYLGSEDKEEDANDEIVAEDSTEYLKHNEERVEALVDMADVLDEYYATNGNYPKVNEVESVLTDSDMFKDTPTDPKQGKIDKAGKAFGYTYAVYDTGAGSNTAYIVSALFEDSRGFAYAWTRGASTKNYSDYRDTDEDHVIFIAEEE